MWSIEEGHAMPQKRPKEYVEMPLGTQFASNRS